MLYTLFALGVSLGWGQFNPMDDPPAAEVVWVQGQVQVRSADSLSPLAPGDLVYPNKTVHLGEEASVVLIKPDRTIVLVEGKKNLPLNALLTSGKLAPEIGRTEVLPSYGLDSEKGLPWQLAPGGNGGVSKGSDIFILHPRQTTLKTLRPTFTWSSGGPVSLELAMRKPNGSFEMVSRWTGIVGSKHVPANDLENNAYYQLTLTGKAGEPVRTVFYVPSAERLKWLASAERQLHTFLTTASLPVPVVRSARARWLERVGLYQEAEDVWAALKKTYPQVPFFATQFESLRKRALVLPSETETAKRFKQWTQETLSRFVQLL